MSDKMREEFEAWYSDFDGYGEAHKKEMWDAWQASRAAMVPKGWQLVPAEVTMPMQHAYFGVIDKNMDRVNADCRFGRYDSAKEAYRAMLAAAPKP